MVHQGQCAHQVSSNFANLDFQGLTRFLTQGLLSNKLDLLIYCTLQMHVQQATYANLLWVTFERATPFLSQKNRKKESDHQ